MKKIKTLAALTAAAMSVLMSSCSSEMTGVIPASTEDPTITIIKNIEWSSTVNNGEGSATATINQSSMVELTGKEPDSQRFNPTINLKVELTEKTIEVESFDALSVSGEEVISENDIDEGTTFGKDVVKKFVFTDGQVATVSYGWRYEKGVFMGNTMYAPHLEISAVNFTEYAYAQDGDNKNKVTLNFVATLKAVNSSSAKTEELTLSPFYYQTKKEVKPEQPEEPVEPTVSYRHGLTWSGKKDGKGTAWVQKLVGDSIAEEWKLIVNLKSGQKKDNSWTVSDTKVKYEVENYIRTTEEYDKKGFHVVAPQMCYHFKPTYNTPSGAYVLDYDFKFYNYTLSFDNGEYKCEIKTDVSVSYKQKVVVEEARKNLYPNRNYLGSDKVEYTYTDSVSGEVVFSYTSYTDLLGE